MKKSIQILTTVFLGIVAVMLIAIFIRMLAGPKENVKEETTQEDTVQTSQAASQNSPAGTSQNSPAVASQNSPAGTSQNSSAGTSQNSSAGSNSEASNADPGELPQDNIVTTQHTSVIKGQSYSYTANTGTMVMESGGSYCEIFFTAYTLNGDGAADNRPITFAFNGGPGASSSFIHFGCLGPRKVELDEVGKTISMPSKIIDNENSILDMTDLVFIDPVGTGYSRAVAGSEPKDFWGYDNDIRSVGDFIRLYVNRYQRWGSPKYIAGESYGTTRAVGLCDYLATNFSLNINGLLLISSANDFNAVIETGANDVSDALFIPTFAADAWYHKKLSSEYQAMELEDYLKKVRAFVDEEYIPAKFKGDAITESEKEALAGKIAEFIGVSEEYVLEADLCVNLEDYSKELLKDKKLRIGRYDGRITGPVVSGSYDDGTSDPSAASTDLAFGNTFMEYVTEELKYVTDRPYLPMSPEVGENWSFANDEGLIRQENTIYENISKNNYLKIWVVCGYYDGATPFYSAEWVYRHLGLNDDLRNNVQITHYPSGHMIYVNKEAFEMFREDAEKWFTDR